MDQLCALLANWTLLFIGFGMQDEYVMRLVADVLDAFGGSTGTHFAPLNAGEADVEELWKKHNVRVIEYAGHGSPLAGKLAELSETAQREPAVAAHASRGKEGIKRRPIVPPAYTHWLASQCIQDVELAGLRPKHGQAVTLLVRRNEKVEPIGRVFPLVYGDDYTVLPTFLQRLTPQRAKKTRGKRKKSTRHTRATSPESVTAYLNRPTTVASRLWLRRVRLQTFSWKSPPPLARRRWPRAVCCLTASQRKFAAGHFTSRVPVVGRLPAACARPDTRTPPVPAEIASWQRSARLAAPTSGLRSND